jgi:NAD(P)-dependent dehydrogenase (short-subunit alcohol dehydrogenase family)
MFDFSGRTVLVTGAAGNLGQAIGRELAGANANLVAVDVSEPGLAKAYSDLAADRLLVLAGIDLTSPSSVDAMAQRAIARFGGVDALIHTVGTFRGGQSVVASPLADWDLLMNVNLRTALLTARALVPHFLERGYGRIVTIAARPALAGAAGIAAYSASKAALLRLTESIADELKGHDITANAVMPGTIDTPQNRAAMPDADTSTWVTPAAVAYAVLFFASEAAGAISGAALPVLGRG